MYKKIKSFIARHTTTFDLLQFLSETVFVLFVTILLLHFKFIIFAPGRREQYISDAGQGIVMDIIIVAVALSLFIVIRLATRDTQRNISERTEKDIGAINKSIRKRLEKIKRKQR